jgi:hypothetical protein
MSNKCICHKNFEIFEMCWTQFLFQKGKYYTYEYLSSSCDIIWVIYNEYGGNTWEQGCNFYIPKDIFIVGQSKLPLKNNFNDYFYTENELRKMKLEKLNNV